MNKFPLGIWKCTKSKYSGFEEGGNYVCKLDQTGNPRIYPDNFYGWAPYWENHNGKFCYPKDELNFKYIGRREGEQVLEVNHAGELPDQVVVNGVTYLRAVTNE